MPPYPSPSPPNRRGKVTARQSSLRNLSGHRGIWMDLFVGILNDKLCSNDLQVQMLVFRFLAERFDADSATFLQCKYALPAMKNLLLGIKFFQSPVVRETTDFRGQEKRQRREEENNRAAGGRRERKKSRKRRR